MRIAWRQLALAVLAVLVCLAGCAGGEGGGAGEEPPQAAYAGREIKDIRVIQENGARGCWSPDGRRIAFDRLNADGYYDLYVMELGETGITPITEGKVGIGQLHNGNAAWHPHGDLIVFISEESGHYGVENAWPGNPGVGVFCNLWAADAEGGRFWKLTDIPLKKERNDGIPAMGVCGHRADIATCQAARALAALDGCAAVGEEHVREAAEMALLHRLRKTPFDEGLKDMERLERIIERKGRPAALSLQDASAAPIEAEATSGAAEGEGARSTRVPGIESCADASREDIEVPSLQGISTRAVRPTSGKRSSAVTDSGNGRRIGHRMPRAGEDGSSADLALDATLRAAAGRTAGSDQPFAVRREDFRYAVRKRKTGNLVLFVVDASASMGCNERIEATKQAVGMLLTDAYRKRDRVGLISFRDEGAQLVLSPTSSVQLAGMRVRELTTGGATPLNHGLAMALQVAKREARREPDIVPLLVLITDGQGNVGYLSDNPVRESLELAARIREEGFPCVVFDTSVFPSHSREGRPFVSHARRIAEAMGAEFHLLARPRPQEMVDRLKGFL